MKIKNRLNNFETKGRGGVILRSGCCCCCCCLHGLGIGSAGATLGLKWGKTGPTKSLLAFALFIFAGIVGLALDAVVLLLINNLWPRAIDPGIFLVIIYGISFIFFTFLAYRFVFYLTRNTKTVTENLDPKTTLQLEARKKAYYKHRFIFQLKLGLVFLALIVLFRMLDRYLLYSTMASKSQLWTWENWLWMKLIIYVLFFTGLFSVIAKKDKFLENGVISGYFTLFYCLLPSILILLEFLLGIGMFFTTMLLLLPISALSFESLRFKYIKAHPEIFQK